MEIRGIRQGSEAKKKIQLESHGMQNNYYNLPIVSSEREHLQLWTILGVSGEI